MSRHDRPTHCGVCGEWLPGGCVVRELVGTGPDDGLYGHAKCIDRVMKRLVAEGATYLGNFEMDR